MLDLKFRYEKVSERVTRIYAFSSELMYLIEGRDGAALLDSGSGIGFVRPLIEHLTDKPLKVLLTHGHVDHAMGASEFPEDWVYINQEDAYIYRQHSTYEFRRAGLFLMDNHGNGVTDADFTPIVSIEKYHDLKEGDQFDLGGIRIEPYACPGHTKGSLVMLIPEERMVLLGDACNANTFIFEDYSTSVEEYQESLVSLNKKLEGKFDTALSSHGDGILSANIMNENIAICQSIQMRHDDKMPMEFRGNKGMIAKKDARPGHGNIVYNPEFIMKPRTTFAQSY